jgi:hypothetical protein
MTTTTVTGEPVPIDVSNAEDWDFTIYDVDGTTGDAIPHTSDTLRCDLRDADDTLLVSMTTANGYLSIKAGTTHGIRFLIPWGTVKDYTPGEYFGTLVIVVSSTSRTKIVDIVVRHSDKPTRTA